MAIRRCGWSGRSRQGVVPGGHRARDGRIKTRRPPTPRNVSRGVETSLRRAGPAGDPHPARIEGWIEIPAARGSPGRLPQRPGRFPGPRVRFPHLRAPAPQPKREMPQPAGPFPHRKQRFPQNRRRLPQSGRPLPQPQRRLPSRREPSTPRPASQRQPPRHGRADSLRPPPDSPPCAADAGGS